MTKLVRLIFRLDFKEICTSFMNEPGTAFGIFQSSQDDFWQNFSENTQLRTINARYDEKNITYRELNIDTKNINGTIENYSGGIELNDLLKGSVFTEMNRLVNKLTEELGILDLKRAGIRFFLVDTVPIAKGQTLERFNKIFSASVLAGVREQLGDITDIAAVFEGTDRDEISYKIRFGPLFESDTSKSLFSKGQPEDPRLLVKQGFNLLADIDLYEKDISFREFTLGGWARTKVRKASSFIDALKARVTALEEK